MKSVTIFVVILIAFPQLCWCLLHQFHNQNIGHGRSSVRMAPPNQPSPEQPTQPPKRETQPIGIPTVGVGKDQYDVISRLLKDRILLLGSEVNDDVANVMIILIKSGNAALLRGSSTAAHSNEVLIKVMKKAIASTKISEEIIQLIPSTDRATATALLTARGLVDLVIPRGSAALIRSVVDEATVPTIETGAGVCHVYVSTKYQSWINRITRWRLLSLPLPLRAITQISLS